MNWTKTIPTKPGAYWWRQSPNRYPFLTELTESGEFYMAGCRERFCESQLEGGEWSGPLVPVEEVRRAYYEGHIHAISSDPEADPQELSWPNSRARRVVEGKEI